MPIEGMINLCEYIDVIERKVYLNKDWRCVILREIDFLLKICWSIPCLHPSWRLLTWIWICASLNHCKKMKAQSTDSSKPCRNTSAFKCERNVIPDMWRAFPDGGSKFQQDYSPCLSSKKVKTVFRKQKINVLDWPGNSPDLNPIENWWSVTRCRLQKLYCTTMTKLRDARDDWIVVFHYQSYPVLKNVVRIRFLLWFNCTVRIGKLSKSVS